MSSSTPMIVISDSDSESDSIYIVESSSMDLCSEYSSSSFEASSNPEYSSSTEINTNFNPESSYPESSSTESSYPESSSTESSYPESSSTESSSTYYNEVVGCDEKDLNNDIFVGRILGGTVLFLDGPNGATTRALAKVAGIPPERMIVPEFCQETYEIHRKRGVKAYLGSLFGALDEFVMRDVSDVYFDTMSSLLGTEKKKIGGEYHSCFPLRSILHYLRQGPDKVHLAITLCQSRAHTKKQTQRGATDLPWHDFAMRVLLGDQDWLGIFIACGFKLVSEPIKRVYSRTSRSLQMCFFDFHLERFEPFKMKVFKKRVQYLYRERHCIKKYSMCSRWFNDYAQRFPYKISRKAPYALSHFA